MVNKITLKPTASLNAPSVGTASASGDDAPKVPAAGHDGAPVRRRPLAKRGLQALRLGTVPTKADQAPASPGPEPRAWRPVGRVLAQMDLAEGIQATSLQVPQMMATVAMTDAKISTHYDGPKERLALQEMQMTAFEALHVAASEIKTAVEDFDRLHHDRPGAEVVGEARNAFHQTAKSIATAQQGRVQGLVDAAWAVRKKRDKALMAANIRFAADIAVGTVKLGASVATMATVAATPMGVVGAALSVVSIAKKVNEYLSGRDKIREAIAKADGQLFEAHRLRSVTGKRGADMAKELLSASPLPLAKRISGPTLHTQRLLLENFLASSARVDKEAAELYKKANHLLEKIRTSGVEGGNGPQHEKAAAKVTELLNEVGALKASVAQDLLFYEAHRARCDAYDGRGEPGALGPANEANVNLASIGMRVGSLAQSLLPLLKGIAA